MNEYNRLKAQKDAIVAKQENDLIAERDREWGVALCGIDVAAHAMSVRHGAIKVAHGAIEVESDTTGVKPIGKCERCGYDVYEYMTHSCPTAPLNIGTGSFPQPTPPSRPEQEARAREGPTIPLSSSQNSV